MKTPFSITLVLLISLHSSAQQFRLDTLMFNGNADQRLNVVVLGDGYLDAQLGKFRNDAQALTTNLFLATPFLQYKSFFNVFAISVPSNVEGAASSPNNLIDNYFGSTYNYGGIQRLLVPTRTEKISSVLANNFPSYDQVIMIVNALEYGGSGGWVATASTNAASSEIAIHEIGHSFGGLADEYWAGANYAWEAPNMTRISSPSNIKWKSWLNYSGVGIFSHTGDASWFKPHQSCKMEALGNPFCAVCREQLVCTVLEFVSVVDKYEPVTVAAPSGTVTFDLDLVKPAPNTLNVQWLLDNTTVAKNVDLYDVSLPSLSSGSHELKAMIYDSTSFDRRGTVFMTTIRWTIQSAVTSMLQEIMVTRPGVEEVVTGIESSVSHFRLQAFPNPATARISIEYELDRNMNVDLSVINVMGQPVRTLVNTDQLPGHYMLELDVSQYERGLYFLVLRTGDFSQHMKILKD